MSAREYPVIFSGPMVRAILEGRKTQTRRLPTSMWVNVVRGDRLWVREMWAEVGTCDPGLLVYRADYPACVPANYENVPGINGVRWRPSIHMPRWASRITLDVRSVRRERLQEISEEDCVAEAAIVRNHDWDCPYSEHPCRCGESPFGDVFGRLWNSLHRKPGTTWADNPEVYRIEFARAQP